MILWFEEFYETTLVSFSKIGHLLVLCPSKKVVPEVRFAHKAAANEAAENSKTTFRRTKQ
jgi:hypothetical protein